MMYSIPKRLSLFLIVAFAFIITNVSAQCPTAVSIGATAVKFCPGGSSTLTANVTGGPNDLKYEWRNYGVAFGTSTSSIVVTQAGFYTVKVTDTVNFCSKTSAGYAISVSPTAGTTISGPLSFCIGSNVTLTADSSTNYTFQWKLNGANITGETLSGYTATASGTYSVDVTDNTVGLGCTVTSDSKIITVYPTTVAGTIAAPSAICAGITAPTLTLSGYTGSIIRWESSTNGTTWNTIVNTSDTYNPGTPSQTTQYRAIVQSGTCASATSNTVTLTVNPLPIATITESASLALCTGGSVTLSNSNGVSYVWKESGTPIGGATNSSLIVNTAGSYTVTVTDGNACSATTASPSIVTVAPVTVPGSVTGGATVCEGSTSGLLTLNGNTGNVSRWESSINSGVTWSTIANTSSTYTSGALTTTTLYRAIVQSGACALDSSTSTTVTVNATSVGGAVSGGSTICSGNPSGLLTLGGYTGNIERWQYATSPFSSWTDTAITTSTFTSGNLTETTHFRAAIKSGICNEAFSTAAIITVNTTPTITSQPSSISRCEGASAPFSVTATGAVSYQWKKGASAIPGEINNSYTIANVLAADAGNYTVEITNSCGTTTSNIAALTVNTLPSATVIASGPTTFCANSSVDLSAPIGNSYQWKKNGTNESTSNPYTASTAGSYTVVVTDGNGCIATSTATVVTVNALPDATITPSGLTTFCAGGSVTLSNTNGVSYQWKKNNVDTAITTSSFAVNSSGDYKVQVTDGNGCVALTATATTVTVDVPSVAGTVSGGTTICSGSTSGLLTLSGNTGSVTSWESAVSPFSSWNTIANTIATYTSAALTATTQFRAVVTNGTCAADNSSTTTVTVDTAPIAGAVSGGTTICSGGTSALLTLSGHTGTITKWQSTVSPFNVWSDIVNTSSTYTSGALTETTRFRAVLSNGACSDVQSTHTEVVVNAPINITVQPTSDTKCVGTSVTFGVTATGAISGYQWKFNGTNITSANSSTYNIASITALDAGNYTVEVQSATCSNILSSAASLTVNSATAPIVQQNVGTNPICQGLSANIRTASSAYASWQWKKDGSNMSGEISRNLALTLSGSYEVIITDLNGCTATSSTLVFTVNPLPSSVITAGGSTNICTGSSVTLSNAETGTYQWISGGVDILGAQTSSYNATSSGNYTIRVTSAAGCQSTTATPITVTVSAASVGGGVTGASGTVCSGSNSPLLTLAGQTGTVTGWESSISPFITWTPIAHTGTTYTSGALTQTTQFRAVVQSGTCPSSTSFEEEIAVTPPSVGGTVSGGTTICSGGNTGTMTLTGKTGNVVRWESAVSPFLTWTTITNTTTSHSATGLTQTTRYRAVVQNTALCAEANSSHAEIVVDNVPTFSLNPSSQSICEGSAVTFTSTATSINPITGYQWKRDGTNIGGAVSNSYTISAVTDGLVVASGDEADYTIVATNTCGNSAPSNAATLTVNILPTAVLTPSGATTFCQGQSIDLTGSGSTAGYKWLKNGTQVSTTNPYAASTSGDYKVVAENGFGCVDTTTITTILVNTLPSATITPSGATTFCSGGSVTLSNNNGTNYVWKESGTPIGGATNNTHVVSTSGNYTVTVTDANGCSATTTPATTVTVDAPTVAGSVTGGTVICQGSNSGILTLAGNTGSVVRWESSINSGAAWSPIVHTNSTYTSGALTQTTSFRAVVQNGTCLALESDTTITTVDPSTVGGTVTGGSTICEGFTSGTLTLASHTGNIVRWESSATIGFASPTTIANTSNTYVSGVLATSTYFRAVVKSGVCNEQNSTATLVTVTNAPVITTQPIAATRCVGTSVTLSVIATGATGYQWRKNSVNIPSANSSSYTIASVSLTDDDNYDVVISNACIPTTTSNTIHLTVNALPTATITPGGPTTFCSGLDVTLTATGGVSYQWRKNTTNNSTTNPYVANTSGSYDVIATDVNGCVSAASTATVVTVNALPDATITPSGLTTFCAGGSVTLSNTNGVSYQWKKNNVDTAITTSSFAVNSSGDYKVQVTDGNGCVALTATATTVTVDVPSVAGTVSGGTIICSGSTSGLLTLSGNTGSVTSWESAVSPFSSWNTIANTIATYTSAALTATTQFRAVVKNGTCAADNSLTTTVTVTPASVGGSVSGGTTPICAGNAPGTLTLSGETGGVTSWESAVSPFITWNTISNVTSTEIPGNLTATTRYRAVVKNGVCPSTNSNHQEIIVNPLPAITAQPASAERCVGGTITFSVTASDAVSYQWKKAGVNISGEITSSLTLSSLTLADADDYSVTVTNACGNITSSNATLTINSLPTVGSSAGGPTTFCNGDNVSLTATGGNTYQWRKDAVNFSTTNPLVVTASGSYDVYAISIKGCTSATAATAIVVTVNSVPSASITPSGSIAFCTGGSQLLTAGGGTTYQWKKDGADVATGTTYTATAAGSYTVVAIQSACSSAVSAATVATTTPAGTWLGTIDSDPNNTANWSCGTIPTASTVVDISSGISPIVSTGKTLVANGITIGAGKTILVNGGTLRIRGSISGTGNINNTSGEVEFFGITDQTIPSGLFTSNTAARVKITNTGTVTLGGALSITDRLTCEDGVFATGGNLTLTSTASGTAYVDAMTPDASITGSVTVQRYIPSSQRRWRFLAAPIAGGNLSLWQDDIYITGTGGATNGFDATSNNSPSVYHYDETTTGNLNQGWSAASSNTMSFVVGKGYRVFVRGDRSDPARLTGANTTQNLVTLDVSGTLNQQTIAMPVTFSNTNSLSDDGWNLLGNPFAAPFDWGAMYRTGNTGYSGTFYSRIEPSIHIYDPASNGYASYNAITGSGTGGAASGIINPGQGFFVKATAASPTLSFDESFKATTSTNLLFKTGTANDELRMTMRSDTFNNDQFVLKFIANASSRDDIYDIKRMNNGANDVYSFGTDNIPHALDARPLSLSVNDTIKLYTGGTNGLHSFTFNTIPIASGVNFYLKDNFLNSITPILQYGVYNFNISSSNTATFGNNRFRIIIENTNALPVTVSKFVATLNNQKQAILNWTTATEKNSKSFEVEHSLDNVNYTKLETVKAKGNSNVQVKYTYTDAGFVKGLVNYYRLKLVDNDNTFTYSSVRQLSEENTIQSKVSDYVFMAPIPTEDYVKIWSDVEVLNGGAEVKIYDTQMKLINTKTVYGFGKLNEKLDLSNLEQGVYIVQIKDKNNEWMVTRKVVKN